MIVKVKLDDQTAATLSTNTRLTAAAGNRANGSRAPGGRRMVQMVLSPRSWPKNKRLVVMGQ